MLRITTSTSAKGAIAYFNDGLKQGDYYLSEETQGVWGGKAAQRLGLSGEVTKEQFSALAHNRKPDGSKLNPRDNLHRRVGWDYTFSVPKSVSLQYAMTGDARIKHAFEEAVEETMQEIEATEMRTQAGRGKDKHYPFTGNMVYAKFTHKTSRPVAGIPDPFLHQHVFVFNTTYYPEQGRFQGSEQSIIKRKAPYFEAAFDSRLAMKMKQLGYGIDRRGYSWELSGLEKSCLTKFSRRTAQIEALAKEEQAAGKLFTKKQKAQLGALTRAKKQSGHSWQALQELWRSWLDEGERHVIRHASSFQEKEIPSPGITVGQAMERAVNHLLERKSVVKEYQVKAETLKRGYGEFLPEALQPEMQERSFITRQEKYMTHLTTPEALQDENRMLALLREGKGKHRPLNAEYIPKADFLNDPQKAAIHHALQDPNHLTLISGGAGVGKTTLVKEIYQGVIEKGKPFLGFAPTASATQVLQSEGFRQAFTLQRLLVDEALQRQCRNAVIWCDEAGLIGNKDMLKVMAIAKAQNARILLTGDVKQHHSVKAGDALRILEKEGGVKVARVNAIQRQKDSPRFKQVIALTTKGKIDTALHQLDNMGGVVELANPEHRQQALIQRYSLAVKTSKSVMIISPTHQEGRQITNALREHLQREGVVQKQEREFTRLRNTNWTQEYKGDIRHYQEAEGPLVIEFHQNAKGGFQKGERLTLSALQGSETEAENASLSCAEIPLEQAQRYGVFRQESLRLAKGDKIRITRGGRTREKTRINTGDVFTVTGFTRDGHLRLHTGKTLDKTYGHFNYGYVSTSHSSQGKTVDLALISQSAPSLPASNAEQFYVSLSRARQMAVIYTDDKQALERHVLQSGQRLTAREIAQQERRNKDIQARKQSQPHFNHSPKERNHAHGKTL